MTARAMSPIVRAVLANAALWRRWNSEIEQARRAYDGQMHYQQEREGERR